MYTFLTSEGYTNKISLVRANESKTILSKQRGLNKQFSDTSSSKKQGRDKPTLSTPAIFSQEGWGYTGTNQMPTLKTST